MELPQPRPFETEGRKATLDFLSLYPSSSPAQQDPTPSQGSYLTTQDFLQPLERVGMGVTKVENKVEMTDGEKLPPSPPSASGEHLLPGGISTYSISYFNQRNPDGSLFTTQTNINTAANDENSNSGSYTGSGFTLWEESAVKKGKTGKENISAERNAMQESIVNMAGTQWPAALERPSPSSSNNQHNATTFSSFSTSQSQPSSSQKKKNFFNMIKSAKNDQEYDDDDDKDFIMKKESPPQSKGKFSVKAEMKTVDEKPNTPRSKHSATEQRRRSKINDRFQNLREIVPNSDQKRDKASFLLEVIEYIQFLQDKVNKYESPYTVWNHEPSKMVQWKNGPIPEGFTDHLRGVNAGVASASVFASKVEEEKNGVPPTITINRQNVAECDTSTATTFKEKGHKFEPIPKAALIHAPSQPNIFTFGRTNALTTPLSSNQASDIDKSTSWPPSQFQQSRSCTDYWNSDNLKEQGLTVESGTISISSVYSQRLLSTLTEALQNSGVDLSQSRISVQIDMGKRANSSMSTIKDDDVSVPPRSKVASELEFSRASKRPRTL